MTKLDKMNEFLQYLDVIFKNNPVLTKDAIYSLLVYYKASNSSIEHIFDRWIAHFKNKEDIEVFVDPDWSYFCQFVNGSIDEFRMIKLYIPLRGTHIEDGAKVIFEFMRKHKIQHSSKIGSHLRNDVLVIRVHSIKDAKKIIDFVGNNHYLQEGMMMVNPFVFNQNGVGLAMDANRSYNNEVSKMLYSFFKNRQTNKITTPPNAYEFANYILEYSKNVNSKELLIIYSFIYLNITKKDYSVDDFFDLVNRHQNNLSLLVDALSKTRNKYGDNQMIGALKAMLNDDFKYVTNDQNMRTDLKRLLSSSEIKSMVNELCGYNKNDVIDDKTLMMFNNNFDVIRQNIASNRVNDLIFAISETIKKYQGTQIDEIYILRTFLNTEDYTLFTRTNGARERIMVSFPLKNIKKVLREDLELYYNCETEVIVTEILKKMNLTKSKRTK